MKYHAILLHLTVCSLLAIAPENHAAATRYFTWSATELAHNQQQLQQKDSPSRSAVHALLKQADAALKHGSFSVIDKTLIPSSGDKHDDYSLAPYQ